MPNTEVTLFESSITAELDFKTESESNEICAAAVKNGIKLLPARERGRVRLCFAGISEKDIRPALESLRSVL